MNSRFAFWILVFAGLLSPDLAQSQQNWAKDLFEVSKHDFGPVGRGAKAEYRFKVKNTLGQDVVISKLRTSCRCTEPSIANGRIAPGEESSIVAKFNTDSFTGMRSATVTVVFAEPRFAEVQLLVTGFVRTDVVINPVEVNFGEFRDGESRPVKFSVSYAGKADWMIKDVRSHYKFLQVAMSERQKTDVGYRYTMDIGLKEGAPVGSFRDRFTIVTNETNLETISVDVMGNVRPELILSPSSLSLGPVQKGSVTSKRLVLRGGVTPFEVTDVKAKDLRFQFTKPEGKKTLHFITVNFAAGQVPGEVNEEITIVTDLKGGKETVCKVSGKVLGGN